MATTEAMKRKHTKNDRKFDRILKAEEEGRIKKSKMSRSVQKMFQNRLAVIGLMVFGGILLTCLLAPLIAAYDPVAPDLRSINQPPSLQHIFGTDKLGRDVFTRTLYGGRLSMLIGLGSALIAQSLACCWAATAAIRAASSIRSCFVCPRCSCLSLS